MDLADIHLPLRIETRQLKHYIFECRRSTDQKPVVRAQGEGGRGEGGGGMEDWHVREVAWHSEMSGVCQGVRSVTRTNICFWTEFFFPFSKFPVMYCLTFVWKHRTAKLGTNLNSIFCVWHTRRSSEYFFANLPESKFVFIQKWTAIVNFELIAFFGVYTISLFLWELEKADG